MGIPLFLAIQFMREGRGQSALVASAMGVGVAVIVFLSALIGGLQTSLVDKTLGFQPHIILEPPREQPRELWSAQPEADERTAAVIQEPPQRARSIVDWQQTVAQLRHDTQIVAVTPVVLGPGYAVRALASHSVVIQGVDPATYTAVVPVDRRLLAGRLPEAGSDVAIGSSLAALLGLGVGDKLRIKSATDRTEILTISGVFRLGNREADERWVLVTLRSGQGLLDLAGEVSNLWLRGREIFDADINARRIASHTGLVARSWMSVNAELLTGLRSQSASSLLIQVFVVLAVAIGIASVLVVSVIQKQREIGILRAVGMSRGGIVGVFLIQGGLLGLIGSVVGVSGGVALGVAFSRFAVDASGVPLFPIEVDAGLAATAAVVAIGSGLLAAVLPALRAGRMVPAEAIRHG